MKTFWILRTSEEKRKLFEKKYMKKHGLKEMPHVKKGITIGSK